MTLDPVKKTILSNTRGMEKVCKLKSLIVPRTYSKIYFFQLYKFLPECMYVYHVLLKPKEMV